MALTLDLICQFTDRFPSCYDTLFKYTNFLPFVLDTLIQFNKEQNAFSSLLVSCYDNSLHLTITFKKSYRIPCLSIYPQHFNIFNPTLTNKYINLSPFQLKELQNLLLPNNKFEKTNITPGIIKGLFYFVSNKNIEHKFTEIYSEVLITFKKRKCILFIKKSYIPYTIGNHLFWQSNLDKTILSYEQSSNGHILFESVYHPLYQFNP